MMDSGSPLSKLYVAVAIVGAVLAGAYHFRRLSQECAAVPILSCLLGWEDHSPGAKKGIEGRDEPTKPAVPLTHPTDAKPDIATGLKETIGSVSRWQNARSPRNVYALRFSSQGVRLEFEHTQISAESGAAPGLAVFTGQKATTHMYEGKHYAYAPKANNCPPFETTATLEFKDATTFVLRGTAWTAVAFGTCTATGSEPYTDTYTRLP
jgi:hypothetical protein